MINHFVMKAFVLQFNQISIGETEMGVPFSLLLEQTTHQNVLLRWESLIDGTAATKIILYLQVLITQ